MILSALPRFCFLTTCNSTPNNIHCKTTRKTFCFSKILIQNHHIRPEHSPFCKLLTDSFYTSVTIKKG
jgi:hypothetical protein